MARLSLLIPTLLAITLCAGHDGHDHDQIPMDYVRFPYQAKLYPGDNDGAYLLLPGQLTSTKLLVQ